MSKEDRFSLLNTLSFNDKFFDYENEEYLDSLDVVRILNHYDKTLGEFIKRDVEQKDKIADLEAKLAESEKALKLCREHMFKVMCADDVPSEEWFIKCARKEENKILEKDKEIERQDKVIREINKSKYDKLMEKDILFHLKNRNKELERQVAEKESEIEKLQHYNDRLAQGIYHSYGEHFVSKIKQDKISFAVEHLGKVLPSIKATIELAENRHQMKDQVDIIIYNQINELRGQYES